MNVGQEVFHRTEDFFFSSKLCLVKFPRLCCEPVPHVLLDVVVRGESFAPLGIFKGAKNGVMTGREVWTVWRVTALDD